MAMLDATNEKYPVFNDILDSTDDDDGIDL
jgi:hypothetical protein